MVRIYKKQSVAPPYLQVAIDLPDLESVEKLFRSFSYPISPTLTMEIGSPLLKNEKLSESVQLFKQFFPNAYLIADLKTLTGGHVEAEIAAKAGVDAASVSALAPLPEINDFFHTCRKNETDSWLDTLETPHNKIWAALQLNESPTGVIIRSDPRDSLDQQRVTWMLMTQIKQNKLTSGLITAAAGDLNLETVPEVRRFGADVVIVGKSIYKADNPQKAITQFLFSTKSNHWEYDD